MSGRKIKTFSKLLSSKVFCPEVEVVLVAPVVEVVVRLPSVGGDNCCVEVTLGRLEPNVRKRFTPYWLIACRLTAANFTCNEISPVGMAGTSRKLVTLGTTFFTTSKILSATSGDDTLPDNMTTGPDVAICTGSDGNTSWIFWLSPITSMSTDTSNASLCPDSSQMRRETPPGALPFRRT